MKNKPSVFRKKIMSLKKEAAIGSLIASHLGSNAILKGFIKSKYLGRFLGKQIVKHNTSPGIIDKIKSSMLSSVAGALPEFEMFLTGSGNVASSLAQGKGYRYLKKYYNLLLKGKSDEKIKEMVLNKKAPKVISNFLDKLKNKSTDNIQKALSPLINQLKSSNPKHRSEAIDNIIKIKNNYGLLKNVVPGMLEESANVGAKGIKNIDKQSYLSRGIAGASLVGTAMVDPMTAGFSGFKRFVGAGHVGKIPLVGKSLERTQKRLSKSMVDDRVKTLFNVGSGNMPKKNIPLSYRSAQLTTNPIVRPAAKIVDTFAANPITSEIKNIAFDVGSATRKATGLGYR